MEELEYEVLSFLIEKFVVERRTKFVVVADHTDLMFAGSVEFLSSNLRGCTTALAERFGRINDAPHALERRFRLSTPYTLLGERERRLTFDQGGWEAFYGNFPGAPGLTGASRAAVSGDRSTVLAAVGNQVAGRNGWGVFYLVTTRGGCFSVSSSIQAYVS